MNFSLFVAFDGPADATDALEEELHAGLPALLGATEGFTGADIFRPDPTPILFFDDGPPPAMAVQIEGSNADALAGLARTPAPVDLVTAEGFATRCGLFETLTWPVVGAQTAEPRTAPMSFLVRYFGPMPDEVAFHRFYTQNHPPLLAEFPKVRNVRCYLPLDADLGGLCASQVRLGNEVVFDAVADLNAAMKSDVMPRLKADSSGFPPFGHSTHHAMQRRAVSV